MSVADGQEGFNSLLVQRVDPCLSHPLAGYESAEGQAVEIVRNRRLLDAESLGDFINALGTLS